jgi:enoyl-CoA hydratase/carnithine racemase
MIHGAHVILFSKDAKADLAFLHEILGKPKAADAGGGWMIYALPPAEIAVHPADEGGTHQLYLMCDDVEAFRRAMAARGTPVGAVQAQRWGLLVDVTMPSGSKLGVYEPKHASPNARRATRAAKPARRQAAKKGAKAPPRTRPAKKRARS